MVLHLTWVVNLNLKHHGKRYKHIKEDLHFEAGMTCQDCHTSVDMHGDGTLFGTTLGQVEIECSDCHGTNDKYPWELKVGYGENFGIETPEGPRGMANDLTILDDSRYSLRC